MQRQQIHTRVIRKLVPSSSQAFKVHCYKGRRATMETTAMRFAFSSDVRSDTDDDGTAILHITHDKIYTIVGVGSAIWSKLVGARDGLAQHEIVERLSADFKTIPRQQIEGD